MNTENKKLFEIARMIDISAVRADSTLEEVREICEAAKKYGFICVFAMPSFVPKVQKLTEGRKDILVGGVVGFPSGAETTEAKVFEARRLRDNGCNEIDMVMNIGKLKSGLHKDVLDDILAVKAAASPLPLKVIIEVCLLTADEIVEASRIVLESGANYLKTGTGWAGATTFEHLKTIFDTVGKKIKVKVAGGVRDLATLEKMRALGVSRFGIGGKSAVKIMEEIGR